MMSSLLDWVFTLLNKILFKLQFAINAHRLESGFWILRQVHIQSWQEESLQPSVGP